MAPAETEGRHPDGAGLHHAGLAGGLAKGERGLPRRPPLQHPRLRTDRHRGPSGGRVLVDRGQPYPPYQQQAEPGGGGDRRHQDARRHRRDLPPEPYPPLHPGHLAGLAGPGHPGHGEPVPRQRPAFPVPDERRSPPGLRGGPVHRGLPRSHPGGRQPDALPALPAAGHPGLRLCAQPHRRVHLRRGPGSGQRLPHPLLAPVHPLPCAPQHRRGGFHDHPPRGHALREQRLPPAGDPPLPGGGHGEAEG